MTLSARDVAQQTAKPILEFGRSWMMAPGTAAKAAELGLTGAGRFGFWANGRAGVLGNVDASIAAAAIGFMAPDAVRSCWEARPADLTAWDAAVAWFGCGAEWARDVLAPMPTDRVERLGQLGRRVVDAADPSIGALFAGSKNIPLPGDAAGDVAITLNVLRELRGCGHLAACHAVGLGPHATIMSTDDPVRGGVNWSEAFGWSEPHPEPNHEARAQIEDLTTTAIAHAYACLEQAEAQEFVDLVLEARAAVPE